VTILPSGPFFTRRLCAHLPLPCLSQPSTSSALKPRRICVVQAEVRAAASKARSALSGARM
jgi:hypothetical protein